MKVGFLIICLSLLHPVYVPQSVVHISVLESKKEYMQEQQPWVFQFIDEDMKALVEFEDFRSVGSLSNGLSRVEVKDGKFGYVNKLGKVEISPQFDEAGNFAEGLARVRKDTSALSRDRKWSYINKEGQVVIQTDFDIAFDFSEDVAVAERGRSCFLIQRDGSTTTLFDAESNLQLAPEPNPSFKNGILVVQDTKSGKYGYINKSGKFIITPQFQNAASFSEGLARVSVIVNGRELVGFIDGSGRFNIPPTFDIDYDFWRNSTDFSEGLAGIVNGPPTSAEDSHFIFITKDGRVALTTPFSYVAPFHEGLAVAYDTLTNRYTYINKVGRQVISATFIRATDFSEGRACVAKAR